MNTRVHLNGMNRHSSSTVKSYLQGCFAFVAIVLLFSTSASAQMDSLTAMVPLGPGHRWQYTRILNSACANRNLGTLDVWIDKDTLLDNGLKYWIRNEGRFPDGITDRYFVRFDSSTGNLYQRYQWANASERHVDSLRVAVGDTIKIGGMYIIRRAGFADTVCGLVTYTTQFVELPHTGWEERSYTLGLGLSTRKEVYAFYPNLACQSAVVTSHLVYARVDGNEFGTLLSLPGSNQEGPAGFELQQNYPNPFNPHSTIRITVPEKTVTDLTVFDLSGRKIAVLIHGIIDAGNHEVTFDATGLPSGTYFCRMRSGVFAQTIRLVLLK